MFNYMSYDRLAIVIDAFFRARIEESVLAPFTDALRSLEGEFDTDEFNDPTPQTTYVYGNWDYGDTLVFMDLDVAVHRLGIAFATLTSNTWGELADAHPEFAGSEVEFDQQNASFPSFMHYCVSRYQQNGSINVEEARNTYRSLSHHYRPPVADETFDNTDYCSKRLEAGVHRDPTIEMNDILPDEILDWYAEVGDGIFNGPYASISPVFEDAVVKRLEELGHAVIKDDMLVNFASLADDPGLGDPKNLFELLTNPTYMAILLEGWHYRPAVSEEEDAANDLWD